MGKKRITRAEAQRGMTRIENELRDCDSYAGQVQDRVRAELGSMSVPPQQERDTLENEEQMNEHYKKVTEILLAKAKADAEQCIIEDKKLTAAERVTYTRKVELERLKLLKTDPELDERQWQVLSDIKAWLLQYPTLLNEVTGDKTFLEGIKNNYISKLEGYETRLDKLFDDVYTLHETCSNYVETSLATFAENTLTPAIDIVKLQHERLETELGEATERSEQLDRRVEELLEEAEKVGAKKRREDMEHQAREESLTQEIAAFKKKLDNEREVIQGQTEKHKRETTDLKSQLEEARTSHAEQVKVLQEDLQSSSEENKNLRKAKEVSEEDLKYWLERVSDRRKEYDELRARHTASQEKFRSAQHQVFSLEEGLRAEKEAAVVLKETAEQEKESLRNELTAVKEARNLAESQIQSLRSQLSTATDENISLQSQLSTKTSLQQSHESEIQAVRSQLSTAESEKELLKHSLQTEIQSLRDQLSTAHEANQSLGKSKQELETRYGRATEVSQLTCRLLQWQISTFDNLSMEGLESEEVFREMAAIVDTMERYAGTTTEAVSMPKYMPGMTFLRKVTELPEPNLAAARQLWISSRCGSLLLDVARAFFMQQEISSVQFALLPWIHASLNCTVTTMCERSTLTPDSARTLLWILQGLVYTATVAREWSDNHAWIPKVVDMVTKIKDWLGDHVPNDEASLLKMVAHQVNEIVITHESPSTLISPNLFTQARCIDSTNSDIPNGMAMVIDNSGMIILFTAGDNAFVFGASEVEAVEFDSLGIVVFIFEPQLSGLPENLRQFRLHDCGRPEAINPHQRLLKTVLPEERLLLVSFRKYLR